MLHSPKKKPNPQQKNTGKGKVAKHSSILGARADNSVSLKKPTNAERRRLTRPMWMATAVGKGTPPGSPGHGCNPWGWAGVEAGGTGGDSWPHHDSATAPGWPWGCCMARSPFLLIPKQCWRPLLLCPARRMRLSRASSHTMGFSWALTRSSGPFPPLLIHTALGFHCLLPPRRNYYLLIPSPEGSMQLRQLFSHFLLGAAEIL